MAITEDAANSPAAVHATTTSGTTGAFTPQANTLVVVRVAADGAAALTTTVTVSDSGSHTWTRLVRENASSGTLGGCCDVWVSYFTTSPGSITVTASWAGGGGANGGNIYVRSLLGAAQTQNGATGIAAGSSIAPTFTLTPTQIGSRIYFAAFDYTTNATLIANGNSVSDDQFPDSTNGDTWAAGRSSADTSSLSSTTYGYTNANAAYMLAGAEILAAAGATPQPIVATQPVKTVTAAPQILRSTLVDPPVLTTRPYQLVVSRPEKPTPPGPTIVLRNTLADPPVLTTPGPIVITQQYRSLVPPAPFLARSSLADVVVTPTATPEPLVVTQPVKSTVPGPAFLSRSSLFDLATPGPLVITQPAKPTLGNQAYLSRSSLVDAVVVPATSTPGPLVITPPFRWAWVGPPFVLHGMHLCVTPRPFTGITLRPGTGTTARPGSGTTSRPNTGVTARPNTGITPDEC